MANCQLQHTLRQLLEFDSAGAVSSDVFRLFVLQLLQDWLPPQAGFLQQHELFVFSPNTGKYGPEITPYLDTFQTVLVVGEYHNLYLMLHVL